jgi:hypothetical protein
VSEGELSLTAELLLLAIDPSTGKLFPHKRLRFERALKLTRETGTSRRREPGEVACCLPGPEYSLTDL